MHTLQNPMFRIITVYNFSRSLLVFAMRPARRPACLVVTLLKGNQNTHFCMRMQCGLSYSNRARHTSCNQTIFVEVRRSAHSHRPMQPNSNYETITSSAN